MIAYNICIYFVELGIRIASHFNDKVHRMWKGEQESFDVLSRQVDKSARYLWFHAASLGEFEQGRPLMERIRQLYPQYKLLLTFYSPSGYDVRKDYKGADIVCYMPVDTPRNARRFLNLVRPEAAFFIKYEFWYNFLSILKRNNIPVYSVSSIFRPSQIFFRWYAGKYNKVLGCFERFFVQNEESRSLLDGISISNVEVVGDTRFDRVVQIRDAAKELPVVKSFIADCPDVFVAGSSWPPDEEIFMKYFKEHKGWKLIIAPHVINESHLAQIVSLCGNMKVVRYSDSDEASVAGADVLIIDCFGLLSSIYRYGTVSYVGGGFGVGIHNTLEAAVWNIPVVIGPNNKRFREAQGLLKNGGAFEIQNYEDFVSVMNKLSDADTCAQAGRNAGKYVDSLVGATEKIIRSINL